MPHTSPLPRVLALATAVLLPPAVASDLRAQGPVEFHRDIRPILADRCFQCHGTDAQARKADLRLDTWKGLTAARNGLRTDSAPGQPAVVPGDPGASALIARIHHPDPQQAMPPAASGLALAADEKELLRRWIAEGAVFEEHWGFLPAPDVAPPLVEDPTVAPTDLDRFIQARLEAEGLVPAGPADPLALVRRAHLDLTGLPPTPEEADAFVADARPDAFDRLLDRLFASPRYGERMAHMWLDAARYADTNGFHHDNVRTAWPYRDWVIGAFQSNMSYDQFAVEQLAGDLLPDSTVSQRIATAFCRMHNINDEGGALEAEYAVEAVCDRIETVATTFMGLTFTCARCHDHKYDPFTQEDYYSLYAYFNSVEERGVYPADFEAARAYPARLEYRPAELEQRITAAEAVVAEAAAAFAAYAPAIAEERQRWAAEARRSGEVEWSTAELVRATATSGHALEPQEDGSVLARGHDSVDDHVLVYRTDATGLRLLRLDALVDASVGDKVGRPGNGNAVVSAVEVVARAVGDPTRSTAVSWRWAWATHEQPNGDFDALNLVHGGGEGWALDGHRQQGGQTLALIADQPFGYAGGTELEVTVRYRSPYGDHVLARPRVSFARCSAALLPQFPLIAGDWFEASPFRAKAGEGFDEVFARPYGPERADGIDPGATFGDVRWRHRPDLADGVPHSLSGERQAFYFGRSLRTPVARSLPVWFGSDDGIKVFLNGREVLANPVRRGVAADQEQLTLDLVAGDNLLVVKVVNDGGPAGFFARIDDSDLPGNLDPVAWLPEDAPSAARVAFETQWAARQSPTYARLHGAVVAAESEVARLRGEAVPVLVMRERESPAATFVLARGAYDGADPERPVERRPPAALGAPWPEGAPRNRLGFARWLTQPDHPLTARVHVNRLWQMVFGRGIVATGENFGQQSDWPSHPELLDWLAREFVRSGWDQQALLRTILGSAAYQRQCTPSGDARTRDPDNRLLSWFPRQRLSGEFLRDQALYVAGLLVEDVGGPSVRPYQPEGLWREVSIGGSSNTQVFVQDQGDALYRRSLYTFWKRTSPNPQMATFDAPTREYCVVQRATTNTPLQQLVLWNDVQFVEAARKLAERTLLAPGTDSERLTAMFRRCTGRAPDADDRRQLLELLQHFRERYRAAPDDAASLLAQGESAVDGSLAPTALAAWTAVASAVLSLDETLVRN